MKALLFALALSLSLPTMAAEFFSINCYITSGNGTPVSSYKGTLYGTVTKFGDRIEVSGRELDYAFVSDKKYTDMGCRSHRSYDSDGYSSEQSNAYSYRLDFGTVELSCALGSVVKRFGSLENLRKSLEAEAKKSYMCVEMAQVEAELKN